ncbi:MAG: hypothetical protein ITF99_01830 [Chryseobacterium sp.]|nr:hypothetical protein [Chryseobacterium sp.]
MENLEKLAEFQLKNEEQLKIVGGNLPIDDSFATTQVGGGYCTSGGQDCQDAIWILFSQKV